MPVAFSYQGEDQKRPAFLGHDRFSFNGFSNQTQFSFGGFANKTNQGQEISYLMHGINYLKKEIANAVKEQKKDGKLQESPKTLGHDVSANKTFIPNLGHEIKTGKIYQDARGSNPGHR